MLKTTLSRYFALIFISRALFISCAFGATSYPALNGNYTASLFNSLGSGTQAVAPCIPGGQINVIPRVDLQACSYVFNSTKGPVDFQTGKQMDYLGNLNQFFANYVTCFYQGYIPPSYSSAAPLDCTKGTPLFTGSPKLVCNIANTPKSEGDTNKDVNVDSQPCGSPANENVSGVIPPAIPTPTPTTTSTVSANPTPPPLIDSNAVFSNVTHQLSTKPQSFNSATWESAQVRGLWVQALKFYQDQVINQEIIQQNLLNIHPRCQAIADDYKKLMTDAKNASDKLMVGIATVPESIYSSTLNFCSVDSAMYGNAAYASDPGTIAFLQTIGKASACYLTISRDNRILMFLSLAKCEVFARVNKQILDFSTIRSPMMSQTMNSCLSTAIDQASSESDGHSRFHNCYDPAIRKFFHDSGATQ
jgi:hypothetical protein